MMSVGARPIARQALPPRAIAVQIAQLIRQAGSYRWMGLYAVTAREIAVIGWSGSGSPASRASR
jgi:hypothetical protein